MKNITDWPTTILTLASLIASGLGLAGVIDYAAIPMANEILEALGMGVLGLIGLFKARWSHQNA